MPRSRSRGTVSPRRETPAGPLDWLLDPAQPAVRFRALRELLGRPANDPEVASARADIPKRGWAADLLAERDPGGWWGAKTPLYRPKYVSTHWKMLVLADLGVSRSWPTVERSCEFWMDGFPLRGGGVGGNSKGTGHLCVVGNMARALLRMGYVDDPRIARSMEWLAAAADPKGGWS
ncbi:nitrogenase subunit NifH (ATPase)-like protein, partial [mine drainage metagenome]